MANSGGPTGSCRTVQVRTLSLRHPEGPCAAGAEPHTRTRRSSPGQRGVTECGGWGLLTDWKDLTRVGAGLASGLRAVPAPAPCPQHLYVWLMSEKAHERQRAVHSCVVLLQFLNHKLALDVSAGPGLCPTLPLLSQFPCAQPQLSPPRGLEDQRDFSLKPGTAPKLLAAGSEGVGQQRPLSGGCWESSSQGTRLARCTPSPVPPQGQGAGQGSW